MQKKYFWILALIIGGLFGAWRMFWFSHSQVPLGYDPGLYIATFHDYAKLRSNFDFSILGAWNRHEPLLAMIASGLHKVGVDYNRLIRWGVGIMSWIPGLLLFFVFKKKSPVLGTITAILYWISLTQYEAFYWGYFKQIIGISLLILILLFLEKRKYLKLLIPLLILIPLHRTTLFITIVIVLTYAIFDTIRQKRIPWNLVFSMIIAGGFSLLVYFPQWQKLIGDSISQVTGTFAGSGFSGDFFNILTWFRISFLALSAALFGLIMRFIKLKKSHYSIGPRFFGFVITLIWVLFKLFNYNRVIIFLDIFVIIFAAQALFFLREQKKIIFKYIVGSIFIFLTLQYFYGIKTHDKILISEGEFNAISNLSNITESNAIIMTTHRNYSPWIMGYSGRDWISPGISDINQRNFDQREQWRRGDGFVKCEMLKNYYKTLNRPIYIWYGIGQFAENFGNANCLSIIDEGDSYVVLKVNL